MMTLNSSNINIFSLKTVKFKNIILLTFSSIFLSACNSLFGHQPPATVYGESATNPYENTFNSTAKDLTNYKVVETEVNRSKPSVSSQKNRQSIVKPISPAVLALLSEADRNSRAGNLDSAVATIERAIRIDTRNPILTYQLAVLRLKQSKPRLAEDLAKKAALLAASNTELKKKSWLLISEARLKQNNLYGAKEAKLKAYSF